MAITRDGHPEAVLLDHGLFRMIRLELDLLEPPDKERLLELHERVQEGLEGEHGSSGPAERGDADT